MDLPEVGRTAMEWALFVDAVVAVADDKREDLIKALVASGFERQRTPYGVASYTPGKARAVVNERVLMEWVRRNRPEMLIQRVNPSYMDALKRICEQEGVCVDRETGAVIPGVTLADSPGTLRIVKDPEAREHTREFVRRLAERGLRQLEEGIGS